MNDTSTTHLYIPNTQHNTQKKRHAMFLSLVLTPCLAEHTANWQQVEMHQSLIALSPSHTASQKSGRVTDQAPA